MRRMKLIALFLCAGTIALFALWPGALALGRDNQFIKNWIKSDRLRYQGYLDIWHIPSQATGIGNGETFLKARCQEFEKKNFGVFLRLTTMEAEEANQRLKKGEKPDMISFGQGEIPDVDRILEPIDQPEGIYPEFRFEQGKGEGAAAAYLYGIDVLLVNDDKLYHQALSPPAQQPEELWTAEVLENLPDGFCYREGKEAALLSAVTSDYDWPTKKALLEAKPATMEEFYQETGPAIMLCDLKTAREVQLYADKNYGPSFSVYPLGQMVYHVQYMGILKTEDADKKRACERLIDNLTSEKVQKKVEGFWALPTGKISGDFIPQESMMISFYDEMTQKKNMVLPYGRTQEVLKAGLEKLQTAKGQEDAVAELKEWLRSACNQ